ncbi:MAG: hypothetical protein IJX99_03510 [Clostridia bacterium]|nr:hypothetical protein [Clostridia bacterium]
MFNNCDAEMSDIFASLYMSIFMIIPAVKDKAGRKEILKEIDMNVLNSVPDRKNKLIVTFYKLFGFNFTMFCCKIFRNLNKIKNKSKKN